METQRRLFKTALIFFLTFSLGACATTKKQGRAEGSDSNQANSGELYGPPDPSTSTENTPPAVIPQAITLILGPGLARAFSSVGVIRVLVDQKIPIQGIVGVETGALVAALYGFSKNWNDFEWKLKNLKGEIFKSEKNIIGALFNKKEGAKGLDEYLYQTFAQRDLSESKIPLRIAVQTQTGPVLIEKGRVAEILRVALAIPGLYPPKNLPEFGSSYSAGEIMPIPVHLSKVAFNTPVVAVDVMGEKIKSDQVREYLSSVQRASLTEKAGVEVLIAPVMNGIDYFDFEKRAEVVFQGKSAAQNQVKDIQKLLGKTQ